MRLYSKTAECHSLLQESDISPDRHAHRRNEDSRVSSRTHVVMHPGGFPGQKPKRCACSAMGRPCLRRSGHYCRGRCLRLPGPQAYAPAARNRQRIARAEGVRRRTRNGFAWPSLSLRHRIRCGHCLFCGEPRNSFFDTECCHFWRAIRRGGLFLHESRCGAALRCRQASVFHEDDDYRRDHTHLLCRASHLPQRAPIFQVIGPSDQIVFERGLAPGLLSYAA